MIKYPSSIVIGDAIQPVSSNEFDSSFNSQTSFDSKSYTKSRQKSVFAKLEHFYNVDNMIEILYLLPELKHIDSFPPHIHVIVGSTLFKSGMTLEGLREVGVAIDMERDRSVRADHISLMGTMLARLGKMDDAMTCFGDYFDDVRNSNGDVGEIKQKVRGFQDELARIGAGLEYVIFCDLRLKVFTNISRIIPSFPSLEQQILNFKDVHKIFPMGSFTYDYSHIVKIISDVKQRLETWDYTKKKGDQSDNSVILSLSTAILILGRVEIYYSMLAIEPLILRHIEAFVPPTQQHTRTYSLFKKKPELPTIPYEVKIAQRKTVIGFLALLNHDYSRAVQEFTNSIELLDPQDSMCDQVKCWLIQCKCMMETNPKNRLAAIMDIFEDRPHPKIYIALGDCYRDLAGEESTSITILEPNKIVIGKQFLCSHLEEAIFNYINTVVSMQQDDPAVAKIYDYIVLYLLLHGGIQYHAFAFFLQLRDYFHVISQYNHLHLSNDDSTYTNFFEIADQFVQDSKLLTGDFWRPKAINLLPQVFLAEDDKLLVMKGKYGVATTTKFKTVNSFYIVPVDHEPLISSIALLESKILTSRTLVDLFWRGYSGDLPSHIQQYYIQHLAF
ncbi:uncharacterized protein SPAPADRAFT_48520 [Spathaspora passalidarum NRRL Y-27907]|uniref:Uncharacterized protein n=1 Tax=Spathaspora passalidarum (strain NRRL Y-27907 / 11-Y1) TaxID=619300 RepID=G3AHA5_SPAPN|nr:uncharacterized protein SPAPADRAFT_48520 [Spathaspora passalidarum NRRL Y-27907]EGW35535.1 hypothetical protein SPAPADRAFT_48520 [Spathaspora passalidarum NRRL Y-27907]